MFNMPNKRIFVLMFVDFVSLSVLSTMFVDLCETFVVSMSRKRMRMHELFVILLLWKSC